MVIVIKCGSWLFYAKNCGICVESRVSLFAQSNYQHKSQASPPKSVAMEASMSYLGFWTWDPTCSGKSQLPCSQRLRLHRLTSSDLDQGSFLHLSQAKRKAYKVLNQSCTLKGKRKWKKCSSHGKRGKDNKIKINPSKRKVPSIINTHQSYPINMGKQYRIP